MKTKLILVVFALVVFSCGQNDELDVNLNTSGSAVLTFTDGSSPIPNAQVRITYGSYGSNFETGNVFEGFTDDNGSVNSGTLNEGSYAFRLDLGERGYLVEYFQIVTGSQSSRTFEISEYSSSVEITLSNADVIDQSGLSFYLISSSIDFSALEVSEIKEKALQGSVSNDILTFDQVIVGDYYLLYEFQNNVYPLLLDNYYNTSLSISRDYNLEVNVTLPSSLLLIGQTFNIQQTEDYYAGVVDNHFRSVSFSETEMTIIDQNGDTFSSEYSYSEYSDGSLDIYLPDYYIELGDIFYISYIYLDTEGNLYIYYYDSNDDYLVAIF